jgi:Fe-Mn family superoxide dismutase
MIFHPTSLNEKEAIMNPVVSTTMAYQLPQLPFALDALAPHVTRETLEYHYGKHHKAYIDKLNQLVSGTNYQYMELDEIIRMAQGAIFSNAAQAWNHTFFWNSLSPDGGGPPHGRLAQAIDYTFGSFNAFKDQFTRAATDVVGSGWVWLVWDRFSLAIQTTSNAGNPMTYANKPLLTCDVWEHAYYIDYRNARPEFLKAYWNIVNWQFAASNFDQATASQLDGGARRAIVARREQRLRTRVTSTSRSRAS